MTNQVSNAITDILLHGYGQVEDLQEKTKHLLMKMTAEEVAKVYSLREPVDDEDSAQALGRFVWGIYLPNPSYVVSDSEDLEVVRVLCSKYADEMDYQVFTDAWGTYPEEKRRMILRFLPDLDPDRAES